MKMSRKRRAELVGGTYTKLLASHEASLAELYRCFAQALPSASRFWNSLAEEEVGHRNVILILNEKLKNGELSFKRPEFVSADIVDSINWNEHTMQRMEQTALTMNEALGISIRVETRILEMDYMQIIEDDGSEAKKILEELRLDTEKHLRNVQHEARRLKWKVAGNKPGQIIETIKKRAPVDVKKKVKEQQAEILDGLISLEEAIGGLYNTFNAILKDAKGFWSTIAAEEMQHAAMLRTLQKILETGNIFHNMQQFQKSHIDKLIDYVLDVEFTARKSKLTHHIAVSRALELEACIYESGFYNTVGSTAKQFEVIAKRLQELTAQHITKIELELERIIHDEKQAKQQEGSS